MTKQKKRIRRNISINDDVNALLETQSGDLGISVSAYIALVARLVERKGVDKLVAA